MQADEFVSDIIQKTIKEMEEEAEERQNDLPGLQLLLEGVNTLLTSKTIPKISRKDLRAFVDGVQGRIENLKKEDLEEEELEEEEDSEEEEWEISSNRDQMQADKFVSAIGQKTIKEIRVEAGNRMMEKDLEGSICLFWGIEAKTTRAPKALMRLKEYVKTNIKILKGRRAAQATTYQSAPNRVASITFGLDQGFKGDFDLAQFKSRVDALFQWFSEEEHSKFMAPCFPVIQSRGTGKTRLFVELRKKSEENTLTDYDYDCLSFLCLEHDNSEVGVDQKYYTKMLSLPEHNKDIRKIKDEKEKQTQFITTFLEKQVNQCKKKKVVLLFDEAQNLVRKLDKVAFRCIRWWLRQKGHAKEMVAVFAGTTSKLAYFDNGTPPSQGFSRNPEATYVNWVDGEDKNNPTKQYDPFFCICNMGCLHEDVPGDADGPGDGKRTGDADGPDDEQSNRKPTDFERAALMGRPLFAQLQKAKQLIGGEQTELFGDTLRIHNSTLHAILQRMLMKKEKWKDNMAALCSILGSRVQMGITTSFAMSSDLVSEGYAHLVDFYQPDDGNLQETVARISFMPDPVCAALGMGLMNKRWSLATSDGNDEFTGMGRKSWSQKATDLFKSRLCLPEKGNAGEVMVALYMLFCGDVLRFELDKSLRTFSVPLLGWYVNMRKGIGSEDDTGNIVDIAADDTIEEADNPFYYIDESDIKADSVNTLGDLRSEDDMEVDDLNEHNVDADEDGTGEDEDEDGTNEMTVDRLRAPVYMHVNFIQVCRNYFRAHSWKTKKSLEWMYKAATAAYVYEGCEAIDLVASVRVLRDGKPYYQPLLVSVKCFMNMAPGQIKKAITKMKSLLKSIRTKYTKILGKQINFIINSRNKKNREDKIRPTKAYIELRDKQIRKEKTDEFHKYYYCPPALCLLVLIGAHRQPNVPKTVDALNCEHLGTFPENDTFRMISVPGNDPFGVSQAVREMTTAYATTEIFSSHSFANGEDLRKPREVIRSRPGKEEFEFVQALFDNLKQKNDEK